MTPRERAAAHDRRVEWQQPLAVALILAAFIIACGTVGACRRTAFAEAGAVPTATVPATATVEPTVTPRAAFIAKWGPRIDRYLRRATTRSPLRGKGRIFAAAAYDAGIDPRLQPAIAFIESTLGKAGHLARRHHNAWGVYGRRFASWGQGIRWHAKYLHRVYWGGAFSRRMARKYCPPTWRHWYAKVKRQMGRV